jgi:glycine cleavage system aminomethyltransferase T
MGALRQWIQRLSGTLRTARRDADLEEELRFHLEMAAADAERRGRSAEEASRVARVRSGGIAPSIDGALAFGRVVEALLFEVKPTDVSTIAAPILALAVAAPLATLSPGDPSSADRYGEYASRRLKQRATPTGQPLNPLTR